MRIADIMTREVLTVSPEMPAFEAWELMKARGVRHLVVRERNDVTGVLSQRDAGGRFGANLRARALVGDMMTPSVIVIEPETTVRRAATLMRGRNIGALVVMHGKRLCGIVTVSDLLGVIGRSPDRPGS